MNVKQYQNELMVLVTFLVMGGTYLYKATQVSSQQTKSLEAQHNIAQIEEVIALQKIWSDKKIAQNVNKLQTLVPASKVNWSTKNKKVIAHYKELNDVELNTLTSKILTLPVEILKLAIAHKETSYTLELQCKW